MLGLGQKTHVDLPQEVAGTMPSEEWKIRNFKQKWFAGETISVAIGQGAVATTPIQLGRAISAIASGGHLVRPHLIALDNLPDDAKGQYKEVAAKYPDQTDISIDPKNWDIITDAMRKVESPVGTGALSAIPGVDFGGKTGSAQTVSNALKAKMGKAESDEYKDNGWFVGVAPTKNPDIVVAVLYQSGEHGDKTAPIAAQVIKAFVQKRRKILNDVAYATPPGYVPKGAKPAVEKPAVEKQAKPSPAQSPAAKLSGTGDIEMAGIWTEPSANLSANDSLGSARMNITLDARRSKRISAAPGMQ
jgi:penicillin-binding protein 2